MNCLANEGNKGAMEMTTQNTGNESAYNATEALESMIDKHGLLFVTTGLELICAEKAEHIRHNWQETRASKPWDKASKAFGRVARQIEPENL
jgi:hypothetical protein